MIIFSEISDLQAITILNYELFISSFQEINFFFQNTYFKEQGTSFNGCFPVKQEIEEEITTGYMKIRGMKIVVNPSFVIFMFSRIKNLSLFIYCCVAIE